MSSYSLNLLKEIKAEQIIFGKKIQYEKPNTVKDSLIWKIQNKNSYQLSKKTKNVFNQLGEYNKYKFMINKSGNNYVSEMHDNFRVFKFKKFEKEKILENEEMVKSRNINRYKDLLITDIFSLVISKKNNINKKKNGKKLKTKTKNLFKTKKFKKKIKQKKDVLVKTKKMLKKNSNLNKNKVLKNIKFTKNEKKVLKKKNNYFEKKSKSEKEIFKNEVELRISNLKNKNPKSYKYLDTKILKNIPYAGQKSELINKCINHFIK